MNSTVALLVVMTITFVFTSFAHSAPGEPRLVQGVLEWPARLTAEPFVVVHTEDGRWYYAEIKTAKHLESAPLTSGMRVSILGTEAKNPYEINAIALGSGDAAALAMALMPLVSPTAAASAPPPPPPSSSKSAATESAQTAKAVTRPEVAMAPAPPVRPPQPPAPDAPPPAKPQSDGATPSPGSPDSPRMAELRGTVKIIAGNWAVVQAADGQIVLVDLSALSSGASSLKAGSSIAVYGTPGDQKFQAMGLIQPDNRPPAKPVTVPPRR